MTSSAEGFSSEKLDAFLGVMTGNRALEFDGILNHVPTPQELKAIETLLSMVRGVTVKINHFILDQDGPLGAAYEGISARDQANIEALNENNISTAILSNNANPEKVSQARNLGIPIFGDKNNSKPLWTAYKSVLNQLDWPAQETAMFGDTPAMDKPLLGLGSSNLNVKDLAALKTLLTGWTAANANDYTDRKLTETDFHPNRDQELLVANFLVFPQKMTLGRVNLKKEMKRRFFKLLINAQIKEVLEQNQSLILPHHIEQGLAA